MYQFFTGVVPFKGKTQDDTFELIKECKVSIPESIPEVVRDFLSKILVKDHTSRLGA